MNKLEFLASHVQEGECLPAQEIADRVGRSLSTALRQDLDSCVLVGWLDRVYGKTAHSAGWLYFRPGTLEPMFDDLEN